MSGFPAGQYDSHAEALANRPPMEVHLPTDQDPTDPHAPYRPVLVGKVEPDVDNLPPPQVADVCVELHLPQPTGWDLRLNRIDGRLHKHARHPYPRSRKTTALLERLGLVEYSRRGTSDHLLDVRLTDRGREAALDEIRRRVISAAKRCGASHEGLKAVCGHAELVYDVFLELKRDPKQTPPTPTTPTTQEDEQGGTAGGGS